MNAKDSLSEIAFLEKENQTLQKINQEVPIFKEKNFKNEGTFKNLVDSLPEYIYSVDYDPETNKMVNVYHSPQCETITGYVTKDFIDDPFLWITMVYDPDKHIVNKFIASVVNDLKSGTIEHRIVRKDGKVVWVSNTCGVQLDENGKLYRQFGFLLDISDRKKIEEALKHNALTDSLTCLPNRKYFKNMLLQSIGRIKRDKAYKFAILFLDLDRFKDINDSFGHMVGDELLVEVSKRLNIAVRQNDIVARFGGDEFAVLVDNIPDIYPAILVAERIEKDLSGVILINEHEIFVTSSIGILMCSDEYFSAEEMLRDADIAMYKAKNLGRACFEIYNKQLHFEVFNLLQLKNDINRGVQNNEFELYYQPIFSLKENKVIAVEALMRWNHPEKGLVYPDNFITIAEKTGVIVQLTEWLISASLAHLKIWHDAGYLLHLSLNLSIINLTQANLIKVLEDVAFKNQLSLDYITLEITEKMAVEKYVFAVTALRSLRKLGSIISLDDFGIGNSSIMSLKNLPVSEIKIDPTFVAAVEGQPNTTDIIRAIILMAHSLQIKVIAEGVENKQQLDFLKDYNCDAVQGYFISKPLTVEAMTTYLTQKSK